MRLRPQRPLKWRVASSYQYARYSLGSIVPHAYHMARTSLELSRYAAGFLPDSDPAKLIHMVAGWAGKALDGWNLTAEEPYEVAGQPFPPGTSDRLHRR